MKNEKATAVNLLPGKKKAYPSFIQQPRSAGILLHITSLPSAFGVGDFGPQAYAFANFLYRSKQTVWQILPINSTSPAQGFAPYGSDGCFGGNTLLISPELLVKEGYLSTKNIAANQSRNNKKTNYRKAKKQKTFYSVVHLKIIKPTSHQMSLLLSVKGKNTGFTIMRCTSY